MFDNNKIWVFLFLFFASGCWFFINKTRDHVNLMEKRNIDEAKEINYPRVYSDTAKLTKTEQTSSIKESLNEEVNDSAEPCDANCQPQLNPEEVENRNWNLEEDANSYLIGRSLCSKTEPEILEYIQSEISCPSSQDLVTCKTDYRNCIPFNEKAIAENYQAFLAKAMSEAEVPLISCVTQRDRCIEPVDTSSKYSENARQYLSNCSDSNLTDYSVAVPIYRLVTHNSRCDKNAQTTCNTFASYCFNGSDAEPYDIVSCETTANFCID